MHVPASLRRMPFTVDRRHADRRSVVASIARALNFAAPTFAALTFATLTFAALTAGLVQASLGQDGSAYWSEYRGPHGDGTSPATGLPTRWSETEHVRWKVAFDGKAWSSPVVFENQVWLTNATPDGKRLSVLCLDVATGDILRDQLVFEIAEPQFCIERNSYASCTPVVEAGRVYLHYGAHGTACMDTADGRVVWSRQDLECDHFRGPASSPILWNGLLILTFDGADVQYLVALDKQTGQTVWKTDRNIDYGTDNGDSMKAYSTPLVTEVAGRLELISPSAGATISYDPATGREWWRVRSGGMNSGCRPVVGNGLAFVGTADGGFQLFAVRLGGDGDVTDTHVAWKSSRGAPRYSSPILAEGRLYFGDERGVVSCVDPATGDYVWQERLEGLFMPSPIYADGKLYFLAEEGICYVIAPGPEFELIAENRLDGKFMASPALAGNTLLLRSLDALYCIE